MRYLQSATVVAGLMLCAGHANARAFLKKAPAQVAIDFTKGGKSAFRAGTYKVVWHATATDTHKTHGTYRFTVKP